MGTLSPMQNRSRAALAAASIAVCSSLSLLLSSCDSGDSSEPASLTGGGGASAASPGTAGGPPASTQMAGAGSSVGGATSAGAGGAATNSPHGAFNLLFRDDFDTLDAARWSIQTHSWDTNLALFSEQSVKAQDGFMILTLLPAPAGTMDSTGAAKQFLGAEVRSVDTLTYGRVRARVKFAAGSAVVSSLVTLYTPWPADNWNELDLEHLGAQPTSSQFNTMVYTGAPVKPPVVASVTPTQDPHIQMLGFDASADFHVYTLEWTPAGAVFSIDDAPAYTWTKNIALMTLPQNVLLTIWASSSAAWAGAVNAQTANASMSYDWVELYRYTP